MISRLILYGAAFGAAFFLVWFSYLRTPDPDFNTRKSEIFAAVKEGRMEEADGLVDKLSEDFPDAVPALLLKGWLKEGLKDLKGAIAAYESSIARTTTEEQRCQILLSIADLHRRSGDLEACARIRDEVVSLQGETENSRQLSITMLIDQSRLEEALNELRVFAEEFPVNPHARRMQRNVERSLKEASEASQGVDPAADTEVLGRVRIP
jgi:tetratricopeptide (TPR) repeat protein